MRLLDKQKILGGFILVEIIQHVEYSQMVFFIVIF